MYVSLSLDLSFKGSGVQFVLFTLACFVPQSRHKYLLNKLWVKKVVHFFL